MLDLDSLVVLRAIVEAGSIRGAAQTLRRTQSAISQSMKRLEDELGFELLDRSQYRVRATAAGQHLYDRARTVLSELDRLNGFASALSAGHEAKVRIVLHGAVPVDLWHDLVAAAWTRAPDTVFEVAVGEAGYPMEQVLSGSADLAILFLLGVEMPLAGLEAVRIGSADFVRVISPDHAEHTGSVPPATLAKIPQIVVTSFTDDDTQSYGVRPGRIWRVTTLELKRDLILRGSGWGAMPRHLVESHIRAGRLLAMESASGVRPCGHDIYIARRAGALPGYVANELWNAAVRARCRSTSSSSVIEGLSAG